MRQRAVIGQKQESCCVLVKASHRHHLHACKTFRQKVHYCFVVSILGRGNHTGRLVEHKPHCGFVGQDFAIYRNGIFGGHSLRALLYDIAVHRHALHFEQTIDVF